MKKTFAVLMLAAMLFSAGCGQNAMDGAKKDAQDAAAKVEQKADEVKKDAEAKVDEAKQDAAAKVDEMKSDAEKKADEMKSDAEAKVDEVKDAAAAKVDEMKSDAAQKLDEIEAGAQAMRAAEGEISFGGVFPGVTADDVRVAYGEPVQTNGEELVFENGAIVNVDTTSNRVKSVRLTKSGIETPKGVGVGMNDYVLNDAYGAADAVKQLADSVKYEYDRGANKVAKLTFTAKSGIITEIESEFNK